MAVDLRRLASLAAAIAAIAIGCGNTKDRVATAPAAERPRGDNGSETEAVRMDSEAVTKAVHAAIEDDEAEIEVVEDVNVPGLTLFVAEHEAERGGYATGVVTADGEVILAFADAARRVVRALGGANADPVAVARSVGALEGFIEPTYPVVEQSDIDGVGRPSWRALLALPRRVAGDDGGATYVYWVACGEPPFWRSELRVAADGAVSLSKTDIWELE